MILNANGGKINDKESNSYDYIGGDNSGTTMSLLPYMPVRGRIHVLMVGIQKKMVVEKFINMFSGDSGIRKKNR